MSSLTINDFKKLATPYLNDPIYDACIEACKHYFGNKPVTVIKEDREVQVHSGRVAFTISFSGNETKFYIQTFIAMGGAGFYAILKSKNIVFRVFSLEEVLEWLELKRQEHEWIANHEG